MWRTQAVEHMLLEDIAGLRRRDSEDAETSDALRSARGAAWRAVLFDWAAIALLLSLRLGEAPLRLGPTVETVFSLGLLAVAIHSGFRLGQIEKLRAVGLLVDELARRR